MNANELRPLIFAELRKIAPELEEGDVAPDKLLRDQVDQLVSAMAAFDVPEGVDAIIPGQTALELAPAIRVNAVAPGVIDTPFHQHVTTPEKMAEFKAFTPLKRIGQPEEIAAAIAYLADSLFMTGQTLHVNGGMFMN